MPKPRPRNDIRVPNRLHIYCEGEKTEPNYIRSYIKDKFGDRLRRVIDVAEAKTNTPIQLVKEAIKAKHSSQHPPGDTYWVVYDRESPAKYRDSLHDQAYVLARDNGIHIALSNVCFEYWLILHCINSAAPYVSYDDLMRRSCLKEEFRRRGKGEYDKGEADIYLLLMEGVQLARTRAATINQRTLESAANNETRAHRLNPYTDMPKLLDAIDGFVP